MDDENRSPADMQYAGVLRDADRASDPAPRYYAGVTIDALGLNIARRLVDLSQGLHFAFSKTLTEHDVTVESLRITFDKATLLFPSFSRESFKARGRDGRIYTRNFQMSDENGRNYNKMKFVGYLCKKVNRNTPARITCEIKGQWRRFVGQNRLMKGDDVCIYRNLLVEDDFHFIFKVARNGGNEEER